METITPIQLAMQIDKKCIVLDYKLSSGKVRRRKMPVHQISQANVQVMDIVESLSKHHNEYLKTIPKQQITRFVEKMRNGIVKQPEITKQDSIIGPNESNAILKDTIVVNDISMSKINEVPKKPIQSPESIPIQEAKTNHFVGIGTPNKIPISTDLNKLNDQDLGAIKKEMERSFIANQIQPGDKEFIYDKRVDFGKPTKKSEWDDSSDEETEDISFKTDAQQKPNSSSGSKDIELLSKPALQTVPKFQGSIKPLEIKPIPVTGMDKKDILKGDIINTVSVTNSVKKSTNDEFDIDDLLDGFEEPPPKEEAKSAVTSKPSAVKEVNPVSISNPPPQTIPVNINNSIALKPLTPLGSLAPLGPPKLAPLGSKLAPLSTPLKQVQLPVSQPQIPTTTLNMQKPSLSESKTNEIPEDIIEDIADFDDDSDFYKTDLLKPLQKVKPLMANLTPVSVTHKPVATSITVEPGDTDEEDDLLIETQKQTTKKEFDFDNDDIMFSDDGMGEIKGDTDSDDGF